MNEIIADFLAQHFINMPYVTRAAGCVQMRKYKGKGGAEKRVPAASKVYQQLQPEEIRCDPDSLDLVPQSRETGILYFEDKGAKNTNSNKRMDTWEGKLELVYWANFKKIGADTSIGDLQGNILQNLPQNIAASGALISATVKPSRIMPKRPSPFDPYTYDEAATQFITPPYDYLHIEISYKALTLAGCATNIILNPDECLLS